MRTGPPARPRKVSMTRKITAAQARDPAEIRQFPSRAPGEFHPPCWCWLGLEDVGVELATRGYPEFRIGLVQVVADRPGTEEELSRYVAVGQPLRG